MTQTNRIQEALAQFVLFDSLSDIEAPKDYGFSTYSDMLDFIITQDKKLSSERLSCLTIDQESLEMMSFNGFNFGELLRSRYEDMRVLSEYLLELSDKPDFETQKSEFLKIKMP